MSAIVVTILVKRVVFGPFPGTGIGFRSGNFAELPQP